MKLTSFPTSHLDMLKIFKLICRYTSSMLWTLTSDSYPLRTWRPYLRVSGTCTVLTQPIFLRQGQIKPISPEPSLFSLICPLIPNHSVLASLLHRYKSDMLILSISSVPTLICHYLSLGPQKLVSNPLVCHLSSTVRKVSLKLKYDRITQVAKALQLLPSALRIKPMLSNMMRGSCHNLAPSYLPTFHPPLPFSPSPPTYIPFHLLL